jgi:hypothetical protein
MSRASTLLLVLAILVPRATWPQGNPVGPEFRANTYTTGHQGGPPFLEADPSVASDAAGNFVVIWPSGQDGSGLGVFGQRYASSGTPLGPEFRFNTYTTGDQSILLSGSPSIAFAATGNFDVVWRSQGQDGPYRGVFGQRYASSGTPLGPEFRVNTVTTSSQDYPAVASDPAGNFIVVWNSWGQDGSMWGVFGQRYASSGTPMGPAFRVNSYTTDWQVLPSVAADSAGNFVVIWRSDYQLSPAPFEIDVFGQRFASSGTPLGPEFLVNSFTTEIQWEGSVAADPAGNFVIVWSSGVLYPNGVFGQRYASSGVRLGQEFRVTAYGGSPAVTADSSGNFVVVWSGTGPGDSAGVFAQRYTNTGAALGQEFRVNTYTTFGQRTPAVAADAFGNFVVVWESQDQDGSGYGIFGQRYNMIVPVELMHFRVE